MGFPGGSDNKESACYAGDPGSFPGSGRSLGEGNGHSLQYSCLENSIDRGAWWATVHGGHRVRHNWATNTLALNIFVILWTAWNGALIALGWIYSLHHVGLVFANICTFIFMGIDKSRISLTFLKSVRVMQRKTLGDFPGDPGVKNLSASAGDISLIPELGRSHMPQGN